MKKILTILLMAVPGLAMGQCVTVPPLFIPTSLNPLTNTLGQPFRFVKSWGTLGSGAGQFINPEGISFDPITGHVFIANLNGGNNIQEYDVDGNYISVIPTSGTGWLFSGVVCTFVDSSGNIYVCDGGTHQYIWKFTRSGDSFSAALSITYGLGTGNGQFTRIMGLVTDSNGNIYVCDNLGHRFQKFDSSGVFQWTKGSLGIGDGQFGGTVASYEGPYDIKIYQDQIYIVDDDNLRVQVFDLDGTYKRQFPIPSAILYHTYMDISNDGTFYICGRTGTGTGDVVITNSVGASIGEIFSSGTDPGGASPMGVAVNGDNVYVDDFNNSKICVFLRTHPLPIPALVIPSCP
jgi:DNA-binding beta-propeller fold protein YncE